MSTTVTRMIDRYELLYQIVHEAVLTAINILKHLAGRHALNEIALAIDHGRHSESQRYRGDRRRAARDVNMFLDKISDVFPKVTIEQRLVNPNFIAYHDRGIWEGDLASWNPRDSMVALNCPKVSAMLDSTE
ncbi:hypothetical protein BDV19DRAFT_390629 [Aspergillus venezuelensis]